MGHLKKDLALFIFSSLSILIKMYFVRHFIFEENSFVQTFILEFSFIMTLFICIEFIKKDVIKKILYLCANAVITLLLYTLLLYHDVFAYMPTYQALILANQVGDVKESIVHLLKPQYLILVVDFLILPIVYKLKTNRQVVNLNVVSAIFLTTFLISCTTIIIKKDIAYADTMIEAKEQGLFTYEILAFFDQEKIKINSSDINLKEKIYEIKELKFIPAHDRKGFGLAENKNIIAVQGEAFQDFVIGLKVNGKEVTPNLNRLLKNSIYFTNIYQQVSQGNTSDAEFTFNTSIYPSLEAPTAKAYAHKVIPSMPRLLENKDYKSLTFHANQATFWNRDELYPAMGFDKFYEKEYFGEKDIIGIGPSDEVLFNKGIDILKEMDKNNQRFYAHFITLSSHHPFTIPKQKGSLHLSPKYDQTIVGDYLNAVHYTDKAIGQFIKDLKQVGIWKDTLFVFYGDHFGLQESAIKDKDLTLLQEIIGHNYSPLDKFNIPVIMKIPGVTIGEKIKTVGGQVDLMPTMMNLLGMPFNGQVQHFGQDLINYKDNVIGIRYYMPTGSFINQDILFKPGKGFEDGKAWEIDGKHKLKENIKIYRNDYNRIQQLMKLSDQYLKSLQEKE